jgi:hypothetical protein
MSFSEITSMQSFVPRSLVLLGTVFLVAVTGCESGNDDGGSGSDILETGGADVPASGGASIACGDTTCTGGKICCVGTPSTCIAASDSCLMGYGSTISCDGPEDCGSGELCMDKPGSFPLSVGCVAGTDPYSAYCHDQADCAGSAYPVKCCGTGGLNGMKRCNMESMCPAE